MHDDVGHLHTGLILHAAYHPCQALPRFKLGNPPCTDRALLFIVKHAMRLLHGYCMMGTVAVAWSSVRQHFMVSAQHLL